MFCFVVLPSSEVNNQTFLWVFLWFPRKGRLSLQLLVCDWLGIDFVFSPCRQRF